MDAYQTSLGRAPETAGLEYWQDKIGSGAMDIDQVVSSITGSYEAQVKSMYTSLLGRAGKMSEVQYWTGLLQGGMSLAEVERSFKGSDEYLARNIPHFAMGGDHMGGLALVGEVGPEIISTGPARIFNASQTARMIGGQSSDAESAKAIREMLQKISDLEDAIERGNENTSRIAKVMEGQQSVPLLVEIA